MIVINRSDGNVTYNLEELRTRRVFTPGESKDLDSKELDALFQMDGGAELIKHYLLVKDKEWVNNHWDAPEEYFWEFSDIEKCLKEDSLDLFVETLDYSPRGVVEIIKMMAWKLPITDLNKIDAIRMKLGFNVQSATKIMENPLGKQTPAPKKERLRQRKED
jgi:hypothetical protein